MFLVEFAEPFRSQGRPPVCLQKTVKDDILEYTNGMKHSLLPGDKVLAPWEADTGRYGPGTVLTGIETRDPLRGKKDSALILLGNTGDCWDKLCCGATDRELSARRSLALLTASRR